METVISALVVFSFGGLVLWEIFAGLAYNGVFIWKGFTRRQRRGTDTGAAGDPENTRHELRQFAAAESWRVNTHGNR